MNTEKLSSSTLTDLVKDAQEKGLYDQKLKPSKSASIGGFFNNCIKSFRFVLTEKENFLFALLQWTTIAACYYLWTAVLSWIPDEVWEEAGKDRDSGGLIDLIVFLWGFVCVGIAAYPIGIFTSCMGASFLLRFNGRQSTILECLKIVMHHAWSIWIFSWIDAWWTVRQILRRLPKKKDKTPLSEKIANELFYQTWKIVSLGFLPAIISGRGVKNAFSDSLELLKARFVDVAKLRFGYSAICWILGIACYIAPIIIMIISPQNFASQGMEHLNVPLFYKFAGIPMLAILTILMLFLRPVYIISACRIYANYARDNNIHLNLPQKSSAAISSLVAFIALCLVATVIILYRDQLGISEILSNSKYLYQIRK